MNEILFDLINGEIGIELQPSDSDAIHAFAKILECCELNRPIINDKQKDKTMYSYLLESVTEKWEIMIIEDHKYLNCFKRSLAEDYRKTHKTMSMRDFMKTYIMKPISITADDIMGVFNV